MSQVVSNRRAWDYRTDDLAVLSLEYDGDCVGRVLTSVVYPEKTETFNIHGSKGSIAVTRDAASYYSSDGMLIETINQKVDRAQLYVISCWTSFE